MADCSCVRCKCRVCLEEGNIEWECNEGCDCEDCHGEEDWWGKDIPGAPQSGYPKEESDINIALMIRIYNNIKAEQEKVEDAASSAQDLLNANDRSFGVKSQPYMDFDGDVKINMGC